MLKLLSATLLTFTILIFSCKEKPGPAEKLRGMYRLDRFEQFDSAQHQWIPSPAWAGYSGYILYDGLGHMAIHLSPKGYKDTDISTVIDSLNPEELKARAKFYQSNYTYFANVTATDSSVVHSKLSATNPREWGTESIREVQWHSDTLFLTTKENIGQVRLRLRWVRL